LWNPDSIVTLLRRLGKSYANYLEATMAQPITCSWQSFYFSLHLELNIDSIIVVSVIVMENSNDDFKWFGEGFDGFPKRLPDDNIEYNIYVLDQNLPDTEIREKLRSVQSSATTLTRQLLKDFIWQRESFVLEHVREDGKVINKLSKLSASS